MFCTTSCGHCCSQQSVVVYVCFGSQVFMYRIRVLPAPFSVTLPPPSSTIRWLVFTTLAVAVIVIVTGLGPQLKVMMPPSATACTTAAEVQPAGEPSPITWSGSLVSTARPAAGTVACPSGLPACSVVPPEAVAPWPALGLLLAAGWRVRSTAVPAVTKAGWPSRPPPAGAVLTGVALPCGTVAGAAATPAQAAAPVSRRPAAASLAQTRPNRPTSRITRHGSGSAAGPTALHRNAGSAAGRPDDLQSVAAGGRAERRVQDGEQFPRIDPVPPGRQQRQRDPGVAVRQPPPLGEHRQVAAERLLRRDGGRGHPVADAAVAVKELRVQGGELVQVPPCAHLRPQVAEREMLAGEEVHVLPQPAALQRVPGFRGDAGRRHPHSGRGRAEAEPGQAGAQGVALVAFGLGNREHDHQPALRLGRTRTIEDPDVALG